MISFMRVPRAGGRFLLRGKANTGDTGEKFTAFHRWYRRRAPVLRRTVRRPGRGREHAAARQSAASRCRFPRLPQCRTPPLRGCAPLRRSAPQAGWVCRPRVRRLSVLCRKKFIAAAGKLHVAVRADAPHEQRSAVGDIQTLALPYGVMPHALMGAEVFAVGTDEAACRGKRPRAAI